MFEVDEPAIVPPVDRITTFGSELSRKKGEGNPGVSAFLLGGDLRSHSCLLAERKRVRTY